jgi:hypothetical protein
MPFGKDPFIKPWMIPRADDHYALDITRARETLGWEPRRSLRVTLPTMVAALKADPLGWYRENELDPPGRLKRDDDPRTSTADVDQTTGRQEHPAPRRSHTPWVPNSPTTRWARAA